MKFNAFMVFGLFLMACGTPVEPVDSGTPDTATVTDTADVIPDTADAMPDVMPDTTDATPGEDATDATPDTTDATPDVATPCGAEGQTCCVTGSPCGSAMTCTSGTCMVSATCGHGGSGGVGATNQPCCGLGTENSCLSGSICMDDASGTLCAPGTSCTTPLCYTCGGASQPCCPTGCGTGLGCYLGTHPQPGDVGTCFCGMPGTPCCAGDTCRDPSLTCTGHVCN